MSAHLVEEEHAVMSVEAAAIKKQQCSCAVDTSSEHRSRLRFHESVLFARHASLFFHVSWLHFAVARVVLLPRDRPAH